MGIKRIRWWGTRRQWLTVYIFACDYHSGQWSYGYATLCRVRRKIVRLHGERTLRLLDKRPYVSSMRHSRLYKHLVSQYADKM